MLQSFNCQCCSCIITISKCRPISSTWICTELKGKMHSNQTYQPYKTLFSSEKHVMSCSLILNTQVLCQFLTLGPRISIWVELEKDILKLWHYIIKRANLIFIYSQFHGCLSFIAYLHFKIFCYEMQNWNFRLEMIFLQSIPWHIFYPLWNIGSTKTKTKASFLYDRYIS